VSVTAVGDDLAEARRRAYELVGTVDLPGGRHRTDIAARAVAGDIALR
jgi:phosphoribosylamine--glycine ligase